MVEKYGHHKIIHTKEVFTFNEDYLKLDRAKLDAIEFLPIFQPKDLNKDEKEEIKKMSSAELDILRYNGFLDNNDIPLDIEYRYNAFKLRGPEIDQTKPVDIFLGCSDTFGLAQFENKIWPHIVSSNLETQYLNLGVPGGSIATCYSALKVISSYVKVNRIFFLIPSPYRSQIYFNAPDTVRIMQVGPNFHKVYTESKEMRDFAKLIFDKVYSVEETTMIEFDRNLDAIKGLAANHNATFYCTLNPCLPLEMVDIKLKTHPRDRARDLRHYGKEYQKQIAAYFIEKVNNTEIK